MNIEFLMEREFDAENFVARLNLGEFDRTLFEEVGKLSAPQLEKVVSILMTKQSAKTDGNVRPSQIL